MKIYHSKDVPNVSKPEGTKVTYFLYPEYEVHYNEQAPGTSQTWHHHEKIWESLYIINGELTAKWTEDGQEKEEVVKTGDLIETQNTPHTFLNHTNNVVKFIVIKQVLTGKDKREILKSDKVIN